MRLRKNYAASLHRGHPLAAHALALGLALALASCSTVEHGRAIDQVASRSLSTATPEGTRHLALELDYDPAVRELVAKMGQPDWLHVVSRDRVYLYFTAVDQVVAVTRPMVPPGEVQLYERTPGFLLNLLPKPAIDRVLAKREADKAKQAAAKRRKQRSRKRSGSPAAIAHRGSGATLSVHHFKPDRVIMRLRTPLSAADPGVVGWRSSKLPDGSRARIATAGTTRYLVRTDAVSASAIIPPRGRTAPAKARHAFNRINQAVFGTLAREVNRRLEPLIARVAGDTSGRTHVTRRVGSRTVSVSRDPQRGVLVYAVHSQ